MTHYRTRFAPSPPGRLHLGHAASAWHVWQAAHQAGGEVLLRIEDIDTTRCRPEFTQGIYEDLAWLGLTWPEPARVQSAHFDAYAAIVAQLAERGLAYRCFRRRAEIASEAATSPHGLGPIFRGKPLPEAEERASLAAGKPYAWRLSLDRARETLGPAWQDLEYTVEIAGVLHLVKAGPERHGDIVIARKDSPSAYHLAATHDDALQGITHIIRGEDLIEAPHIQTLLQVLMNWPQPVYRHHSLILGPDGQRLSKRNRSETLAALRKRGMSVPEIRRQVGFE